MSDIYDTEQPDGEALLMLDLWGMQSTSALLSLPGLLWLGVIVPDIYGSNRTVWHLNCVQTKDLSQTELLEKEQFDHLPVSKPTTDV